jgi:flagellar L-ring protein precursor FlgH
MIRALLFTALLAGGVAADAAADNLFHNDAWAHVAADQRAHAPGDVLTVVVYQNAEARDAAANTSRKQHDLQGAIAGDAAQHSGSLSLNGAYTGQGEVSRSQSFVTQISVTVDAVEANGDLRVSGSQVMTINGEHTTIRVRGRVRPVDIDADNQVLSTRIGEAQIDYDGRGFVSRNAGAGLIQRLFGLLGLGG